MHASLDSTVAHTGRFSATFGGGERAWIQARAGVCQALCNRNLAGKHLRLSGWVKTDSLKSLAFLKLYAHTLHGVETAPTGPVFSAQTDWSLATIEMDTPPDTYEIWAWGAYTAPAPGAAFFDDLSLEVTGPAARPKRGERKP
jgi:hypothetical protein